MKEVTENDLLYQHDIKLYELSIRLDELENLVNRMMQKKPPYWANK